MTALATTAQLAERLPFVMDEDETREAEGALEDLSDDARHYGKPTWSNPENTPQPVINLILRAAARHMKNPDGYVTSRAGDEAITWTDRGELSGSATFTREEQLRLKEYGGFQGRRLHSVNTFAATNRPAPERPAGEYVYGQGDSEPIHYFRHEREPW